LGGPERTTTRSGDCFESDWSERRPTVGCGMVPTMLSTGCKRGGRCAGWPSRCQAPGRGGAVWQPAGLSSGHTRRLLRWPPLEQGQHAAHRRDVVESGDEVHLGGSGFMKQCRPRGRRGCGSGLGSIHRCSPVARAGRNGARIEDVVRVEHRLYLAHKASLAGSSTQPGMYVFRCRSHARPRRRRPTNASSDNVAHDLTAHGRVGLPYR